LHQRDSIIKAAELAETADTRRCDILRLDREEGGTQAIASRYPFYVHAKHVQWSGVSDVPNNRGERIPPE
jgi:hypothetical protein